MWRVRLTCLLAFGGLLPAGVASAQVAPFGHQCHDCCATCAQPVSQCSCQSVRPVVSTHLERQQVVTYQNVAETRLRQEQVVQRVPTVRYQDVTVDEGGYQMVWVPRPVTKRVAQVECRDQVATRTVPYTVTRTVPQVSTRLVPRQTVSYVAQQHTIAMPIARPVVGCSTCGTAPFATTYAPPPASTAARLAPARNPVTLSPAITASLPAYDSPSGEALFEQARLPETELTAGPQPDPAFATAGRPTPAPMSSEEWTTIGQRNEPPRVAIRPRETSAPSTAGRFTPVPTAAAVWQATGTSRR